jgi:DNA-binding NarL/FixJ family response regulator
VLRLLAQGKRMKEIAAELGISVRTVENQHIVPE